MYGKIIAAIMVAIAKKNPLATWPYTICDSPDISKLIHERCGDKGGFLGYT